ncbi:MAG: chloride channel protein, partial [Planctomycetales bacterium]|nr:chloride channel protein [Planctomycetales bacterium]
MVWFKRVGERLYALDWNVHGKWFVLSGLIGVVAGVGAIAFQVLTQVVMHYGLGQIAGYHPGEPVGEHGIFPHVATTFVPWLIVAVAAVGGLLSGIIVYSLAPEAEGHGTDAAIDAFHNKRGAIKPLIPLVKTIASAITIGTGGSGGREGPIAQIGAGFGSYLAHLLKLTAHDRRIMLAAGMGAGVGAIFRAPLAGALFAGEILYSEPDIESDVIVPTAMSSIVAYTVYTLSMPPSIRYMPLFGHELQYSMGSPLELIPYAMLSVILTLFAALYIKVFYGVHKL